METVNIHQAKTNLSRLLARVEMGEEFIIANRGVPVAKLVPLPQTSNRKETMGCDRDKFSVPEDFDAPMPEEFLSAFEGEDS